MRSIRHAFQGPVGFNHNSNPVYNHLGRRTIIFAEFQVSPKLRNCKALNPKPWSIRLRLVSDPRPQATPLRFSRHLGSVFRVQGLRFRVQGCKPFKHGPKPSIRLVPPFPTLCTQPHPNPPCPTMPPTAEGCQDPNSGGRGCGLGLILRSLEDATLLGQVSRWHIAGNYNFMLP